MTRNMFGRRTILVLIAVVLALACGKKDVVDRRPGEKPLDEKRTLVTQHTADPETRSEILAIIDGEEAKLREFYDFYDRHNEKLDALNARYDATRAEFEEAQEELNARYRELLTGVISDRYAAKELVTPEEWALISDRESSLITD